MTLPTCRKCPAQYLDTGTVANQYGYCTEACRARKMLYNKVCQLASCGVKYTSSHEKSRFCCRAHKDAFHELKRAAGPAFQDIPTDRIEAILNARARARRVNRTWLRITDPWQQRPGAALHERHQWAGVE